MEGHAVTKSYKKNTVIVSQGDETDSFYVLLTGRVRVYLDDERGKEIIINTLGPGESFGELALLSESPRSASVVTLEPSKLAVVSKQDFVDCLEKNPKIAVRMIRLLVRRIQALTENVSSLALLDVFGRVARLLATHAKEQDGKLVTDRMTHQEIANTVGASREMVSRILKDLKAGGYISAEGKRITLERKIPAGW
jgi:CRP/FNR family cyclic AMP-dependent transcriptional regulator